MTHETVNQQIHFGTPEVTGPPQMLAGRSRQNHHPCPHTRGVKSSTRTTTCTRSGTSHVANSAESLQPRPDSAKSSLKSPPLYPPPPPFNQKPPLTTACHHVWNRPKFPKTQSFSGSTTHCHTPVVRLSRPPIRVRPGRPTVALPRSIEEANSFAKLTMECLATPDNHLGKLPACRVILSFL